MMQNPAGRGHRPRIAEKCQVGIIIAESQLMKIHKKTQEGNLERAAMPEGRGRGKRKPADSGKIVKKLLSFLLPSFRKSTWKERLQLLEQIDCQIIDDFEDLALCRQISRKFTEEILKELDTDVVYCKEQAFIFLNSNDERHNQAARAWFIMKQVPCAILEDESAPPPVTGIDHRLSPRHNICLAGLIGTNATFTTAKLIDISASGAKVSTDTPLPTGTEVILDIPFLGRVAALVVWAAASAVGLSFPSDPINWVAC